MDGMESGGTPPGRKQWLKAPPTTLWIINFVYYVKLMLMKCYTDDVSRTK